MSATIRTFIAFAVLPACMLSPTDDRRVSSTTTALTYSGYTIEAGAPVQVRAWDFNLNRMVNVGAPVAASTTARDAGGTPIYSWSASRTLAPQFWRTGPVAGRCAVVGAQTTVSGRTYDVITVESDWANCYGDNPSAGEFYTNCRSSNSPVAKLYTTDWPTVAVSSSQLALAGLVATSQISLMFDNYTATAYQFCSASTPSGCPGGDGSDPEMWKYFQPNASWLDNDGERLTFSIDPSRSNPMTIYIDNMQSRSLDFSVAGNRFVLGVTFEARDPEIRMNCIRNAACPFVDGKTIDFTAPRAQISFALAVEDGHIVFTDVSTVFTTGLSTDEANQAAAGIADAITEKLTTSSSIRRAVNSALDAVIHGAAGVDGFPIEQVTVSSGTLSVLPACPQD